jgi:dihydrodipicolinate synthase/N-acetylneuraminate lyase
VDDAVLEAIGVDDTVWIAGLANALPRESVELFNCGLNGESHQGFELYRWFLPLLRMDTVPNFVQLIKLVQAEVGMGNPRVRAPRLELVGEELEKNRWIMLLEFRRFDADEINAERFKFRDKLGPPDNTSDVKIARFCDRDQASRNLGICCI